ncbi:MAG: energy transducer TonB [Chitinispirillaceae bacterium]
MQSLRRDSLLKVYEYEIEVEIAPGERLFRIVTLCSFLLFGCIGLYLRTHNPPPQLLEEKMARARQVSFIIEEDKKPKVAIVQPKALQPKPLPVEEKKPEPLPEKPIDLTNKPVLNQKIEDAKPDNSSAKTTEPVRRVYGLRKVYSMGIGDDGAASDAVVGKLGNTLATDIDTFTATGNELKGILEPVTTVRSMPRYKVQVKPEYSKAMIENGIQGIINAKILIDVDGKVKKVIVLDDLGYGSKQKVYEACLKLEFEPARMQDGRAVAVWLTVPFRFEITQ